MWAKHYTTNGGSAVIAAPVLPLVKLSQGQERQHSFEEVGECAGRFLAPAPLVLPLSVQVSYQVGICDDTENKRSSSGCAYQFCFKGVQRLAAKANVSAARSACLLRFPRGSYTASGPTPIKARPGFRAMILDRVDLRCRTRP